MQPWQCNEFGKNWLHVPSLLLDLYRDTSIRSKNAIVQLNLYLSRSGACVTSMCRGVLIFKLLHNVFNFHNKWLDNVIISNESCLFNRLIYCENYCILKHINIAFKEWFLGFSLFEKRIWKTELTLVAKPRKRLEFVTNNFVQANHFCFLFIIDNIS